MAHRHNLFLVDKVHQFLLDEFVEEIGGRLTGLLDDRQLIVVLWAHDHGHRGADVHLQTESTKHILIIVIEHLTQSHRWERSGSSSIIDVYAYGNLYVHIALGHIFGNWGVAKHLDFGWG